LTHFITKSAEAERYRVETEKIAKQNAVDSEQYRILHEAQTQAEVQRMEEEIVQAKRLNEEKLRQAQAWATLKLRLVSIAGYILIPSVGLSMIVLSVKWDKHGKKPVQSPDQSTLGHKVQTVPVSESGDREVQLRPYPPDRRRNVPEPVIVDHNGHSD